MNEIRDLIIGIDIGKEYTQICYYDRKAEEARSLSMKVGASQYEAPGCICYRSRAEGLLRRPGSTSILPGKKAESWLEIFMISAGKKRAVQVAGEERKPAELLAHIF